MIPAEPVFHRKDTLTQFFGGLFYPFFLVYFLFPVVNIFFSLNVLYFFSFWGGTPGNTYFTVVAGCILGAELYAIFRSVRYKDEGRDFWLYFFAGDLLGLVLFFVLQLFYYRMALF